LVIVGDEYLIDTHCHRLNIIITDEFGYQQSRQAMSGDESTRSSDVAIISDSLIAVTGAEGDCLGASEGMVVGYRLAALDAHADTQNPRYTLMLRPNFPNPFNATTGIRYDLPTAGPVKVAVYDLAGRFVTTLVDGWQSAGSYEASFDGTAYASGVYCCRLEHPAAVLMQKMILIK
jgi:hypothetical protein